MPERKITMGAAEQIGALEYDLFARWYRETYNQEPPPNDVNLNSNPLYGWWRNYRRKAVWSPEMETAATRQAFQQVGQTPFATAAPALAKPPVWGTPPSAEEQLMIGGRPALEWEYGLPQFEWQQEQARLAQEEKRRQEGISLWQSAQERQQQNWMIEQNLKAQQYGEAAERFAAMTRGEPQPDWAGMSKTYEDWRRRLMSELQSPEDWITRWQVQNQQNPYQRPETTPAEEATRVGEEVKKWDALIKTQKDIIKRASQDPEVAVSQADLQLLKWAEQAKDVAEHSLVEWETKDIELGRSYPTGSPIVTSTYQPGGEGGITEVGWGANEPARPTTPPTPSWLRSMYPQLGERLPERGKVQPLAPLSGQAWTALTPSQQAGWGGYARYAGASPEDLMALTQKMLPRTPYVSGRWSPARQMA